MRRFILLAAVAVCGALGWWTGRDAITTSEPAFGGLLDPGPAVLSPGLVTTWFCPGVASTAEEPGSISLLNHTDIDVEARVQRFTNEGAAPAERVLVAARGMSQLTLAGAPFTAVVVEATGLIVEQVAVAAVGTSRSPCATSTSPTWYAADGSTSKDARYDLMLFNPFANDAVVDLSFVSDEGRNDERGVVVPAGRLRVIDVGERGSRRKPHVGTIVHATSGRLVVGRVQQFDGTGDRTGVAAGPLLPRAVVSGWFASGQKAEGRSIRIVVLNPADNAVPVSLVLYGEAVVTPQEEMIEPNALHVFDLSGDASVPSGLYRIEVRSDGAAPIVIERVVDTKTGFTSAFSTDAPAARWWMGPTSQVSVGNPTGERAHLTVFTLGPGGRTAVDGGTEVDLDPGAGLDLAVDGPVYVAADGPVIVEGAGGPGVAEP